MSLAACGSRGFRSTCGGMGVVALGGGGAEGCAGVPGAGAADEAAGGDKAEDHVASHTSSASEAMGESRDALSARTSRPCSSSILR